MKGQRSIDSFLKDLFERIDPDQIIPDENSHSVGRASQYKAPDHFLFDRRILVERKSLRADPGSFLARINSITKEQGKEFVIFGEVSTEALFRSLKEPTRAHQRFARMSLNKLESRIIEARDKFQAHSMATGILAASRVLVVSEEGEAMANDGRLVEWFLGQLFLRRSSARDKVGLIDSIIYIRDPAYTLAGENAHWFKWVTREKITREQRTDISFFGSLIYNGITGHFRILGANVDKFPEATQLLV